MPNNAAWNVSSHQLLTRAIRIATSRQPLPGQEPEPEPIDFGAMSVLMPDGEGHGKRAIIGSSQYDFGPRTNSGHYFAKVSDIIVINGEVASIPEAELSDGERIKGIHHVNAGHYPAPANSHWRRAYNMYVDKVTKFSPRSIFTYKGIGQSHIGRPLSYYDEADLPEAPVNYLQIWRDKNSIDVGVRYFRWIYDEIESGPFIEGPDGHSYGEDIVIEKNDGTTVEGKIIATDPATKRVWFTPDVYTYSVQLQGAVIIGVTSGARMTLRSELTLSDAGYEAGGSHKQTRIGAKNDNQGPYVVVSETQDAISTRWLDPNDPNAASNGHVYARDGFGSGNRMTREEFQSWTFRRYMLEMSKDGVTQNKGYIRRGNMEWRNDYPGHWRTTALMCKTLGLDMTGSDPRNTVWVDDIVLDENLQHVIASDAAHYGDIDWNAVDIWPIVGYENGALEVIQNFGSAASLDGKYLYVFDHTGQPVRLEGTSPRSAALSVTMSAKAVGETITIQTDGTHDFGQGPQVALFDGFRQGTPGETLSLTTPQVGEWDEINQYYSPRYHEGGRDGGACYEGWDHEKNRVRTATLSFPPATEVFISYARKHPAGYYYPSPMVTEPNAFPSLGGDSCLKESWLMSGKEGSAGDNDLCLMTHWSGQSIYGITGNDYNYWSKPFGNEPEWFRWDRWVRSSFWLKAGEIPDADNGVGFIQITNGEAQYTYHQTDRPLFDTDRNNVPEAFWDTWKLSSWARGSAPGETKLLFDDAYVAYGPNAAARVELGNAPIYEDCTDLAICPTTSWTRSRITAVLERGGIDLNQPCWLFITLSDNTTRYSIPLS